VVGHSPVKAPDSSAGPAAASGTAARRPGEDACGKRARRGRVS
jgi:hypothetical protein